MPSQAKSSTLFSDLARLSCLVSALGSRGNAAWWNCSFLSQEGLETLTYNFPRTAVSAAVTATTKAAALKHDQAAGAVGIFHLFRLPAALMERVHRDLVAESAALAETLSAKDPCLDALRNMADTQSSPDRGPGARNLGQFASDDEALITSLATSYLTAFTKGYETFPYFTLA